MEVKDTAIHTEFYWQVNAEKGTEEIQKKFRNFRKQQKHGINLATWHVGKMYK